MLTAFILGYLALTLIIGFWVSRRIKTSTDFTLAGRGLGTFLVGFTLFATWFGSSSIMGNPGYFAENGFSSFVTLTLTSFICLTIVGIFYAKKLYEMNIVTIGDFFQKRFSKRMDTVVSIIMVFSYPHWIAAQFVALAYLFQSIMGIPINYGIMLGAGIVIIYTYVGGMWAVSYTDMLQGIIILVGLIILLFTMMDETGGITPLFENKPDSFFSPFPKNDWESWNTYLAAFAAFTIGAIPVQEIYQRVFSAKSTRSAVQGIFFAGLLLLFVPLIPLILGLGANYLYPELLVEGQGENLIPYMVSQISSMPVQIMFYGALISAILSTSSGAMLAPATVIGENLIRPYFPKLTDARLLLWTRLSVVLVAVVSGYFAMSDADIVGLVIASLSLIMVCVFAPLTFGLFWKRASLAGAWTAIICGGLSWFVCYLFDTAIDPTLIGTPVSCVAMYVGSLVKPDKDKELKL
jgi:SSS family transporter